MPSRKLLSAVGLALALMLFAETASAQRVLARLQCAGTFGQLRIQGLVFVNLWQYSGGAGSMRLMIPHLLRGELGRIPGRLSLYGQMVDSLRRPVHFDVHLHNNGTGTGAVWFNHMRHRATYMRFVWRGTGFVIYPETGGAAPFRCRR